MTDEQPTARGRIVSMEQFAAEQREKRRRAKDAPGESQTPEWDGVVILARELAEKGVLTTADIVALMTRAGYLLQHNEVLMRHEVHLGGELVPAPLSDGTHAEIVDAMRIVGELAGKDVAKTLCNRFTVERAITAALGANKKNPICDYLVDVQVDHPSPTGAVAALASCFKDRAGVFPLFIRKWLMGCVARELLGFQNYTLVLDGPQGIGKSTFAKWLCSGLGYEYFQEGILLPGDKDHRLRLATKFIWAVDEFGETFAKSSQNALKAFLTQETISERPPYGKHVVQARRHCNIIATSNDGQFLCDVTGNRRYLTVHLEEIDHGYMKSVNIDEVWAEIAAYVSKEYVEYRAPWVLTDDDRSLQAETNKAAEEDDVLADFLEATLERRTGACIPLSVVYGAVFEHFNADSQFEQNRLQRQARSILKHKWKIEQHRTSKERYFADIALKPKTR